MNTYHFQFLAEEHARMLQSEADHRRLVAQARYRPEGDAATPSAEDEHRHSRLDVVRHALGRVAARLATG